jgi:hypothetical protein
VRRETCDREPLGELSVSVRGALAGFGGFDLTVFGRCGGDQIVDEDAGDAFHSTHRTFERLLIRLGRISTAADFSHVLESSGVDLSVGGGRIEVVKGSD